MPLHREEKVGVGRERPVFFGHDGFGGVASGAEFLHRDYHFVVVVVRGFGYVFDEFRFDYDFLENLGSGVSAVGQFADFLRDIGFGERGQSQRGSIMVCASILMILE